jgi:hypothetical protein
MITGESIMKFVIFVHCDGDGNHILHNRGWPHWVGNDQVLIRCDLCHLEWRQSQAHWLEVVEAMESIGQTDLALDQLPASRSG